jgi:hypothetical protein
VGAEARAPRAPDPARAAAWRRFVQEGLRRVRLDLEREAAQRTGGATEAENAAGPTSAHDDVGPLPADMEERGDGITAPRISVPQP